MECEEKRKSQHWVGMNNQLSMAELLTNMVNTEVGLGLGGREIKTSVLKIFTSMLIRYSFCQSTVLSLYSFGI